MNHRFLAVVGSLLFACGDNSALDPNPEPTDDPDVVVSGEFDVLPLPQELWFRTAGSGFVAKSPKHEVRFENGAVTIEGTASDGQRCSEPFSVTTTSVAMGRFDPQITIGTVLVDPRGDLVLTHAGYTEHFRNTFFGVEQSWRFPTRPLDPGAIVVRVKPTGQEFVNSSRAGLHFGKTGDIGITYGHGLWIDANLVEYYVPAIFENGFITLQIPAAVVAASAFPAVLDPNIDLSDTFAESSPTVNSPTGSTSTQPAVASAGLEFMSVWRDTRNGPNSDIYAMRMSSTGSTLSNNSIKVAADVGTQSDPQIASLGTSYLVVWEDFKAANTEADLVASRISATGTVTRIGAIASTGVSEVRPRIAARGAEALVVFQSGSTVRAVKFDGSAFGAPFDIGVGTQASVAADPTGNYLVTYTDAVTHLIGQLVTPAGTLGTTLAISNGGGTQSTSSAAFDGTNFIVVWQNANPQVQLFGTRVSPAGTVLDTHLEGTFTANGVPLITSASGAVFVKNVDLGLSCSTASSCLLVWQDRRTRPTTDDDVYSRVLNTAGGFVATGSDVPITAAIFVQRGPRVAFSAALNRHFVIWQDLRDSDPEAIYGTRVSAVGAVQDPFGIYVALGNNRQSTPAVARISNATDWILGWSDSIARGNNIVGVRVSDTLNSTALSNPISNAVGHQDAPAIAASATNYLVAWTDQRSVVNGTGTERDIFATLVSSTGSVSPTVGFSITEATRDQARPRIASSGSNFLVVWGDRQSGIFHVFGALVSAAGIVTGPFQITSSTVNEEVPSVAFGNGVYFVVWQDSRADRDIYGARIDASTGNVLDPGGVAISTATGLQLDPKVAFGANRFLVVWEDRRNGLADIFGARVQASTTISPTVNDPGGIAISTQVGKQTKATVEFISATAGAFAIVWVDERAVALTGTDLYGVSVFESDGIVADEFPISTSTDNESAPALGRSGPAQANGTVRMLLTYQRTIPSQETDRVVMRRINFGASTQNCTTASCNQNCKASDGLSSCDVNCANASNCTTICESTTCFVNCEDTALCTTNCNGGSTCNTDCRGATVCHSTCAANAGGSTCEINCADPSTGTCTDINCNGGSRCILRCNPTDTAADCSFATCSGGATNCGGGVFACHTPCP